MAETLTSPAQAHCPHYPQCGGCQLQHLNEEAYKEVKEGFLTKALTHYNVSYESRLPLRIGAPATRRRAQLKARNVEGHIHVGYYAERSHDLVNLTTCLVILPLLRDFLPPLREGLRVLLKQPNQSAEIFLLSANEGIDLHIILTQSKDLHPQERTALLLWAEAQPQLARLQINQELIFKRATPTLTFGGTQVAVDATCFLQASAQVEHFMVEKTLAAIQQWVPKPHHLVDLFCGRGTFSLPLGQLASVASYESDEAALDVLRLAAKHTRYPVTIHRRNLMKEPLAPLELRGISAVVIDPPRAGADAQSATLANSDVACIISISCNPITFARDAATLCRGGYKLVQVQAIDQFHWSTHLEVMGVFIKLKTRLPKRRGL